MMGCGAVGREGRLRYACQPVSATPPSCLALPLSSVKEKELSVLDEVSEEADFRTSGRQSLSVPKGAPVWCAPPPRWGVGGVGWGRGIFPEQLTQVSHPSDLLPGMEEMTRERREGISGECLDPCLSICITKLLAKSGLGFLLTPEEESQALIPSPPPRT